MLYSKMYTSCYSTEPEFKPEYLTPSLEKTKEWKNKLCDIEI